MCLPGVLILVSEEVRKVVEVKLMIRIFRINGSRGSLFKRNRLFKLDKCPLRAYSCARHEPRLFNIAARFILSRGGEVSTEWFRAEVAS